MSPMNAVNLGGIPDSRDYCILCAYLRLARKWNLNTDTEAGRIDYCNGRLWHIVAYWWMMHAVPMVSRLGSGGQKRNRESFPVAIETIRLHLQTYWSMRTADLPSSSYASSKKAAHITAKYLRWSFLRMLPPFTVCDHFSMDFHQALRKWGSNECRT